MGVRESHVHDREDLVQDKENLGERIVQAEEGFLAEGEIHTALLARKTPYCPRPATDVPAAHCSSALGPG